MSELAQLDIAGPVATLTLNRPDKRNALSIELIAALDARVAELESAGAVKVVVLTGAGKVFCAGMDLKAVLGNPEAPPELLGTLGELTLRLRALPAVLVGKVNGAAIGGGCGLMCVCDISITHADAKLGFPEVDLGVCPAVVAPWVVRKIGAGPARRVLLSGGTMDGARAHQIGLVDLLVDTRTQLDAATDDLVQRLSAGGARALAATKSLLNELDGSVDAEVIRRGAKLSAQVLATDEAQAMLRARFSG